jgi:hypothetical protein
MNSIESKNKGAKKNYKFEIENFVHCRHFSFTIECAEVHDLQRGLVDMRVVYAQSCVLCGKFTLFGKGFVRLSKYE